MADPLPYVKGFSFSGFQATNPSDPLPGPSVDSELANVANAVDGLVDAVKDVRRSDGALANGSVGPDQLSSSLNLGFEPKGPWTVDTAYGNGDGVFHEGFFYTARLEHTSTAGTEPAGVTTATWLLQFSTDSAVGNMSVAVYDAGFKGVNVYDTDNHDDGTTNKVFTAVEKTKLAGIEASATATPYLPAGAMMPYGGLTEPTGWLFCYGQAVSRTAFAALFAALSTTYGVGDGSTTFNVPDLRGRVVAGPDDMGGTSANRLTGLTDGVDGDTLGAAGGLETNTLTAAQLASHSHGTGTLAAVSAGAHTHTVLTAEGGGTGSADSLRASAVLEALTRTTSSNGAHTHTITGSSAAAGSGSPHNNVQPTLILNYIIKT